MKDCVGVRPICSDGKNAICNTTTGEWECPAVITEEENDAKEAKTSDNGEQ